MGKQLLGAPVDDRDKIRAYETYLVVSSQAGDRAAARELVEHWQPKLLAHAWRLTGDGESARDMTQDAWLEIFRGLPRLDDAKAFPAWALRILTRRCAKAIGRKQRRRAGEAALVREPVLSTEDGEETGLRGDNLRAIQPALAELPAPQQAALALFYRDEMSIAEIAVALEIPVGTVKTRLMHARRKLREKMKGDDDD